MQCNKVRIKFVIYLLAQKKEHVIKFFVDEQNEQDAKQDKEQLPLICTLLEVLENDWDYDPSLDLKYSGKAKN